MCGIFGVIADERSKMPAGSLKGFAKELLLLSESRGREAAGLGLVANGTVQVLKRPLPAGRFIREPEFQQIFRHFEENASGPVCIIGHSRLVTNGRRETHYNNQPVISSGIVGIHNGIIVNERAIRAKYQDVEQTCNLDTEVLLALLRKFMNEGSDVIAAFQRAFAEIRGAASVALLFEDVNGVLLGTNTGSLYLAQNASLPAYCFTSEKTSLEAFIRKPSVRKVLGDVAVTQIKAGEGCLVDLSTLSLRRFQLQQTNSGPAETLPAIAVQRRIVDMLPANEPDLAEDRSRVSPGGPIAAVQVNPEFEKHFQSCRTGAAKLRRCTRCILPETMPFIDFDAAGVCSYCRNYEPINPRGHEELAEAVREFRRAGGEIDCIASISGGRDSSFGLHYLKNVLGLHPITYTYDWGMVTDLARRNIARLTGKLGVEHILVSADITKKRANIRKNLSAWLRRPNLGLIPLLMAGDKQFFYHGERLRRELGVKLVVLCDNLLEKTNFKTGFCGVRPTGERTVYRIPFMSRIQLGAFYAKEFALNPAYLNSSILDTVAAYGSYYVMPHHMLSFFRFIPWDEQSMTRTLIDEYEWEVASDTTTTWRIGDGTAAFYNYVYFVAAGFTENDTFRSNQIREGMITREEALTRVEQENLPRWESIQWYCDVVGIDWRAAVATVNKMPKAYPVG